MKDTLYRIETTMKVEQPELSGSAMILCNGGAVFAELHPVKIKAKVKEPCEFCAVERYTASLMGHNISGKHVQRRFCSYCGRQLPNMEEWPWQNRKFTACSALASASR